MSELSTARYIREHVFGIPTQAEFARLLNYTQATISRFETGEIVAGRDFQERVRALARERKVRWNDRWFFEVPKHRPRERVRPKAGVPRPIQPAA
jgi:transcriptional regulator with XRE-family HTH domain